MKTVNTTLYSSYLHFSFIFLRLMIWTWGKWFYYNTHILFKTWAFEIVLENKLYSQTYLIEISKKIWLSMCFQVFGTYLNPKKYVLITGYLNFTIVLRSCSSWEVRPSEFQNNTLEIQLTARWNYLTYNMAGIK